jgi:hypothetical protein
VIDRMQEKRLRRYCGLFVWILVERGIIEGLLVFAMILGCVCVFEVRLVIIREEGLIECVLFLV